MSATITSGLERFAADAAAREVQLGYQPFPKQQQFHASPAKYRLFGGAAGPGKSKALLMEAILQANDTPGANTLLLRRTFPELEQSLLLYFRRDVPRELYKSFNESKHVVEWMNGSTTRFGYCQSEHDVYQYQGAEFLFIGIDELTLFTLRQWQFLTSRNRCPFPGAFPCMAGATNPGNIGHAWLKSLWIDKKPAPGMESPSEYDPTDYDFVAARVIDNPIYAADENYLKTLRTLPTHLRRAFLDGDWEVFAGQYFDRFDYARNVIRAEQIQFKPWHPRWLSIDWGFEHPSAVYWHASVPTREINSDATPTPRSAGFQPAFFSQTGAPPNSDPAPTTSPVGAWHAMPGADPWRSDAQSSVGAGLKPAPTTSATNESVANPPQPPAIDGVVGAQHAVPGADACRSDAHAPQPPTAPQTRVITYREYVTRRTPPRELAREIVRRSVLPDSSPERIDAIYLSPDAFARRTDEASIAEQMGDIFVAAGLPRPTPADDDRIGGWMLMYQMLDAGRGPQVPGEGSLGDLSWFITDNCIELLRTIPNLVRDQSRVEDVEKMDGDDPADAARYGLKSRYATFHGDPNAWRSRMPLTDRIASRAVSPDPTVRALQIRRFAVEERRAQAPVKFAHRHR